jgi:hypothetical protein
MKKKSKTIKSFCFENQEKIYQEHKLKNLKQHFDSKEYKVFNNLLNIILKKYLSNKNINSNLIKDEPLLFTSLNSIKMNYCIFTVIKFKNNQNFLICINDSSLNLLINLYHGSKSLDVTPRIKVTTIEKNIFNDFSNTILDCLSRLNENKQNFNKFSSLQSLSNIVHNNIIKMEVLTPKELDYWSNNQLALHCQTKMICFNEHNYEKNKALYFTMCWK